MNNVIPYTYFKRLRKSRCGLGSRSRFVSTPNPHLKSLNQLGRVHLEKLQNATGKNLRTWRPEIWFYLIMVPVQGYGSKYRIFDKKYRIDPYPKITRQRQREWAYRAYHIRDSGHTRCPPTCNFKKLETTIGIIKKSRKIPAFSGIPKYNKFK